MATKSVLLLAACLAIGVSARDATAAGNSPETIRKVDSIDLAKINEDLKAGVPTIDVAIYLCEERGKPHGFAAAPKDLVASFQRAQEIFADAGVQLKLLWVRRREVPKDWLSLQANDVRGGPSPPEMNKYVGYRAAKWGLTKKSEEAFEGIIERQDDNHRTIYLLYLQKVQMAYPDPEVTDRLQVKTLTTSGLSLPAYLFETRIPRRIRGVITLTRKSGKHGRLIAHELGHKLINVSHEYRAIAPQFAVRGDGGLMLYGSGTDIPPGKEGRWHRERLHLSPFIYRLKEAGMRQWNTDYRETGHYYDPLYGDQVVRFGIMEMPE